LGYYKDRPLTATSGSLDASRPALQADGTIACAIFAHLKDPKDRVALAAVGRVFHDAEKSDASLPGGSAAAVYELGAERERERCRRRREFGAATYGKSYADDREERSDDMKTFYWMRKAADLENADAMFKIGYYYEYGIYTVERDEWKAVEWYERAVARYRVLAEREKDVDAMYTLGQYYYMGTDWVHIYIDEDEAFEWYKRASEYGHADASYMLGELYGSHYQNSEKAMHSYLKSAEEGNLDAMVKLGVEYIGGFGRLDVEKDETKAFKWFERATDPALKCKWRGNVRAMCWLAYCYEVGLRVAGVEENAPKAVELYLKALDMLDPRYSLVLDYDREGFEAFLPAPPRVRWRLGRIYEHGKPGVAVNKTEALKWYGVAAEGGDSDARVDVERLESELKGA